MTQKNKPQSALETGQPEPIEQRIRRRAYENYLTRGDSPGSDLDDWLRAEQEIRGKKSASSEGGVTVAAA
jgi:hypothetical protein